jgi:hypothetical protein
MAKNDVVEEKSWFQKNWLILLIILVVIVLVGFINFGLMNAGQFASNKMMNAEYYDRSGSSNYLSPISNADFAPEISQRQLIKTSNIAMETKRGKFFEVESRIKTVVTSSDAIILSENFQTLGTGSQTYNTNTYQIKIETLKYDFVVSQLKDLGGIISFSESSTDVTGEISNSQVEIEAEKERLRRYEKLVSDSASLNDKITLTDRMFEQDRRIKYLEEGLQSNEQDVAYSTINLRLQEKPPALYGVALVGIGSLFKTLVGSLNALLYFVSAILPWIIIIGLVFLIVRWVARKISN